MSPDPAPVPKLAPASALPSARRQATRERLLDAAIEVFAEAGLQGASVAQVSKRAGFTRGAFYSNFSDKEELFLAALSREYSRRAADFRSRAAELTEQLRQSDCRLTPRDAAAYVTEFFAPNGSETTWFALETEFLLLALREPGEELGFTDFKARFTAEIATLVEDILHAAGRRFTIPVENAVPILGGVHERAIQVTALSGPDAPEGLDELGDRLAELLFAITEGIEHSAGSSGHAGKGSGGLDPATAGTERAAGESAAGESADSTGSELSQSGDGSDPGEDGERNAQTAETADSDEGPVLAGLSAAAVAARDRLHAQDPDRLAEVRAAAAAAGSNPAENRGPVSLVRPTSRAEYEEPDTVPSAPPGPGFTPPRFLRLV
ncbi:MAG: TetR/AcrR family transcriptional regulator [Leucobacter sp.]